MMERYEWCVTSGEPTALCLQEEARKEDGYVRKK